MKRRKFLSYGSLSVLGGTAGCLGRFKQDGDPDDNSSTNGTDPNDTIGNTGPSGVFLGTADQISIQKFNPPDIEYQRTESTYTYRGSEYPSFDEMSADISLDIVRREVQSLLTEKGILPSNNILVRREEFRLVKIENREVRKNFNVDRMGYEGIQVKYIQTEQPDISFSELMSEIPHSADIEIQLQATYNAVIPITVREFRS